MNSKQKLPGRISISGLSYSAILMIALYCTSCSVPGKLTIRNLSEQYNPDNLSTVSETKVFNLNDSISLLYLRFPLSGFKYKKSSDSIYISASFKILVQLFDSYSAINLTDSFSCRYIDTLTENHPVFFEKEFNLKARRGNNFLVEITLFDIFNGTSTVQYIPFCKKSAGNRNDFLLLRADNSIIYNDIITRNNWMKVRLNNNATSVLSVRFYQRNFPVALPPFSMVEPARFNYKADSIFILAVNNGESELFDISKKGFFHIQSDTVGKEGLTLFRFDDDFPLMKTAESIIPPVRYLTSSKEFEEISETADKKEAIDNFWLTLGGNANRAKVLIKNYYNRVTYANIYFSSYLEGWKTDRGMIYIIFGKPSAVYRSDYNESWIYGSKGNIASTRFDFVKVNNPFTDNDYSLIRVPVFKDIWYITVDNWRR